MARGSASAPVITFLSDYGHRDEFVGVCHGVLARRCPQARVIDLSHGIPPQDVRAGALVLAAALPYTPAGVHLAVVDPGVGARGAAERRAVALRTRAQGRLLVGPDNGLLAIAGERLGGVEEAVEISDSPERLEPVSRTFHGRDLFAPVAAALACGRPLTAVGRPLDRELLHGLELSRARIERDLLVARVLHSDHFGNVILDALPEQLCALRVSDGARVRVQHRGKAWSALRAATFAEVPDGELLLYEDSLGMLALAINGGSAATTLATGRDDELLIGPA